LESFQDKLVMDITIILLIIPANEYILLFELLLIYEKAFTHSI